MTPEEEAAARVDAGNDVLAALRDCDDLDGCAVSWASRNALADAIAETLGLSKQWSRRPGTEGPVYIGSRCPGGCKSVGRRVIDGVLCCAECHAEAETRWR